MYEFPKKKTKEKNSKIIGSVIQGNSWNLAGGQKRERERFLKYVFRKHTDCVKKLLRQPTLRHILVKLMNLKGKEKPFTASRLNAN